MFNKGQLAGLMKQAQAMQDNMKKAQDELGFIEVSGESGAGLVKITMTCKHDVKRVTIDPSLLKTRTCLKTWWLQLLMPPCDGPRRPRPKKWASSLPACPRCRAA